MLAAFKYIFTCRVHIELERSRDLGYQRQPSPQMDRFRALGIDRAVENAELQDKLEKAQNELRRAQAELRLNQSDYERSQVEMEQMQEKVCIFFICSWLELPAEFSWPASNKVKVLSHCAPLVAHKASSSCANLRPGVPSRTSDHSYAVRAPDFCLFPSIWTAKFYSSAPFFISYSRRARGNEPWCETARYLNILSGSRDGQ